MADNSGFTVRGVNTQISTIKGNNAVVNDPNQSKFSTPIGRLDYTKQRDVDYHIQFNRYKYERLLNRANFKNTPQNEALVSPSSTSQELISTIKLPLLSGIRHGYSANMENFRSNFVGEVFGEFVNNDKGLTEKLANSSIEFIEGMAREFKNIASLGAENRGIVNNVLGVTNNPREEASFVGMGSRSHSFEFLLIPRNPDEAKVIQAIIREMKLAMHPSTKGFSKDSNGFLDYPDEFTIGFYSSKNSLPLEVPPIPDCFLTAFSVDYNGNNQARFYDDNTAMSYRISMQFTEANVLTRDEIEAGGF